jgi:hypothetical protein
LLDGGDGLRFTLVNGSGFRVLLHLGWGGDEVSNLWIGGERHKERPPLAIAAAATSPCDFGVVMGSTVVELGQEDLGRGERCWGELAANGPERNEDLQGAAAGFSR